MSDFTHEDAILIGNVINGSYSLTGTNGDDIIFGSAQADVIHDEGGIDLLMQALEMILLMVLI